MVCAGGNPVGASAVEGTDGLAGSESVLDALVSMMETDYRGAMRTMIATANPAFDEEAVRMRVNSTCENCPQEVAAERMRSWIADNALEPARTSHTRVNWASRRAVRIWCVWCRRAAEQHSKGPAMVATARVVFCWGPCITRGEACPRTSRAPSTCSASRAPSDGGEAVAA